jgi:GT2 family glycosyltransferase
MKVGICIVFYKDTQHLKRLAKAIKALDYQDLNVFFTDNHVSKIHVSGFEELYPQAVYIESKINTGFAGGNNILAKHAVNEGCDFVWILNPDMAPHPACLTQLLECIHLNIDTEAVGPVLLYGDANRSEIIQFAGTKVDFISQKKTALYSDIKLSQLPKLDSQEVDLINGGSLLIRAERVKKEDLFSEEYFLYNDEIDLMRRIKNEGHNVKVVFNAVCSHHHDWSKKNAANYHLMYYYMMRNKILYWKKYDHHFQVLKSFFESILKFPFILRFCIKTSGIKLLYFYYLGLLHGYLGKHGKAQLFD